MERDGDLEEGRKEGREVAEKVGVVVLVLLLLLLLLLQIQWFGIIMLQLHS